MDDALNGDMDAVQKASSTDAELAAAMRAIVRALRVIAVEVDAIDERFASFNTRMATMAGGIIVTVLSAAILLALRTG